MQPIESAKQTFRQYGYVAFDTYLIGGHCAQLVADVEGLMQRHKLPRIRRTTPGRDLDYRVMDGHFIDRHIPEVARLVPDILTLARKVSGIDLESLENRAAAINVNITGEGGEYRWHFDRNAVTAILYFNAVEGGETELLPNSRRHLGRWKHTRIQRWLDRRIIQKANNGTASNVVSIEPEAGRLLLIQGDRCLHSVNAVRGKNQRVNAIFTFDSCGTRFHVDQDLDPYLYTDNQDPTFDPNYVE